MVAVGQVRHCRSRSGDEEPTPHIVHDFGSRHDQTSRQRVGEAHSVMVFVFEFTILMVMTLVPPTRMLGG